MKGILTAAALLSTIGFVTTAAAIETTVTVEKSLSQTVVSSKATKEVNQEVTGSPYVKFKSLEQIA